MSFKSIIKNKWTKRGALLALFLGVGVGVAAAVKKSRNSSEANPVYDINPVSSGNTSTVIGSAKMTKLGNLYYNNTSILHNGVGYKFTKTGIEKIQRFFSKNTAAKAKIDASGGIDGIIGGVFAGLLNTYLNTKKNVFDYQKTMNGVIIGSKLNSNEYTKLSV